MGITMLNALSIDLEDWFHAELVRARLTGDAPERRVAWAAEPVLTLLDRYKTRATFFVVGDVLRHHPELVRRIHAAGHEIGCHGWSHRPLWTLAPERFAQELDEFDRDTQGIVPADEIIGYRAPTFSLDERTAWAVDVLRDHGYLYDSSIFPVRNYMYGVDGCPPQPYRLMRAELTTAHAQGDLLEFPLSAYRLLGLDVPVSGGFYLRALPLAWLRTFLARLNAQGKPFVLYLHPWEADAATPHVRGLGLVSSWITYYSPASALKKLEALLQAFRLAPLRDVLALQGQRRQLGTQDRA
jgi:peptidoglycan-N-acetylglucosamine deacetylase